MVTEALSFTLNNFYFIVYGVVFRQIIGIILDYSLRHFSLILAFYGLMKNSGCTIFRN